MLCRKTIPLDFFGRLHKENKNGFFTDNYLFQFYFLVSSSIELTFNFLMTIKIMMMMTMNSLMVRLTDKKRLFLFPARTIVRDSHHHEFRHVASKIWICAEPEVRFCWMNLSSSDNQYNTALHNHYTTSLQRFDFQDLIF